ncbi:MATH and LRR domain-containing protein PFE0570w-like [Leptopilina boulardi]|uniref:MATH and LRR domain-containing protein PFE0570w-like n=1 Tax=Leptopilina boulardi TaxID=63433 RepID=UPI0021F5CAFE|nr:MATH and LRR domain-containing protein PFE0570w-like [Leptopilina boulardi]
MQRSSTSMGSYELRKKSDINCIKSEQKSMSARIENQKCNLMTKTSNEITENLTNPNSGRAKWKTRQPEVMKMLKELIKNTADDEENEISSNCLEIPNDSVSKSSLIKSKTVNSLTSHASSKTKFDNRKSYLRKNSNDSSYLETYIKFNSRQSLATNSDKSFVDKNVKEKKSNTSHYDQSINDKKKNINDEMEISKISKSEIIFDIQSNENISQSNCELKTKISSSKSCQVSFETSTCSKSSDILFEVKSLESENQSSEMFINKTSKKSFRELREILEKYGLNVNEAKRKLNSTENGSFTSILLDKEKGTIVAVCSSQTLFDKFASLSDSDLKIVELKDIVKQLSSDSFDNNNKISKIEREIETDHEQNLKIVQITNNNSKNSLSKHECFSENKKEEFSSSSSINCAELIKNELKNKETCENSENQINILSKVEEKFSFVNLIIKEETERKGKFNFPNNSKNDDKNLLKFDDKSLENCNLQKMEVPNFESVLQKDIETPQTDDKEVNLSKKEKEIVKKIEIFCDAPKELTPINSDVIEKIESPLVNSSSNQTEFSSANSALNKGKKITSTEEIVKEEYKSTKIEKFEDTKNLVPNNKEENEEKLVVNEEKQFSKLNLTPLEETVKEVKNFEEDSKEEDKNLKTANSVVDKEKINEANTFISSKNEFSLVNSISNEENCSSINLIPPEKLINEHSNFQEENSKKELLNSTSNENIENKETSSVNLIQSEELINELLKELLNFQEDPNEKYEDSKKNSLNSLMVKQNNEIQIDSPIESERVLKINSMENSTPIKEIENEEFSFVISTTNEKIVNEKEIASINLSSTKETVNKHQSEENSSKKNKKFKKELSFLKYESGKENEEIKNQEPVKNVSKRLESISKLKKKLSPIKSNDEFFKKRLNSVLKAIATKSESLLQETELMNNEHHKIVSTISLASSNSFSKLKILSVKIPKININNSNLNDISSKINVNENNQEFNSPIRLMSKLNFIPSLVAFWDNKKESQIEIKIIDKENKENSENLSMCKKSISSSFIANVKKFENLSKNSKIENSCKNLENTKNSETCKYSKILENSDLTRKRRNTQKCKSCGKKRKYSSNLSCPLKTEISETSELLKLKNQNSNEFIDDYSLPSMINCKNGKIHKFPMIDNTNRLAQNLAVATLKLATKRAQNLYKNVVLCRQCLTSLNSHDSDITLESNNSPRRVNNNKKNCMSDKNDLKLKDNDNFSSINVLKSKTFKKALKTFRNSSNRREKHYQNNGKNNKISKILFEEHLSKSILIVILIFFLVLWYLF